MMKQSHCYDVDLHGEACVCHVCTVVYAACRVSMTKQSHCYDIDLLGL